ncbi:MAG: 16S rRNA (cytosine(967)-C(5))-methyltransferase RsmB [Clostridia bacterium]|nr:16S rRNA (cytosine(967)-C(5))-methyltransferase RsmB [Clostridia bacterium]
MNKARLYAFRSLVKSTGSGFRSDLEAESVLQTDGLSRRDKNLYSKLLYGVIEKKITLDYLLSRLSTIPLNTLSREVLCVLELGAFQILYLDRVPDRAAIFESGELAKNVCRECLSYVNALLRRVAREKETLHEYLDLPGKKGLALRYGYPRWMVSLWSEAYGKEKCEAILAAMNTPAPLTVRVNTVKIERKVFERHLSEDGVLFHNNPLCDGTLTIESETNPARLFGFEEGLFFVQDAAAAAAVDRLMAKPGEKVLDVCAAPGGKSFGAAVAMENRGEVLSLELHPTRVELIRRGAERLGLDCIRGEANDSSKVREDLREKFDRVICDVPCSGLGVIAKKPDIRHKDKEETESLPPLQLTILESASTAVRPGGMLLYATCTLNPAENEAVTEAFLTRHKNFHRVGEAQTVFPVGGEHDGFFSDLLEKDA